ncbi:MAG: DUF5672 family protein [Candidatus Hydrogenedentales bacterium]|jgi:hypothetical protein
MIDTPKTKRRRLKGVTLWSCAHNDAEYLHRTVLVLKFCELHFEFDDVLLLTHLAPASVPSHWRVERIPSLNPAEWNRFHIFSVPRFIRTARALSVHEDGFPIQPELWSDDFLAYDYIGAPWPDGLVGNGGFCLESKKLLDMKLTLQIPKGFVYPSDLLICKLYRPKLAERGIRFAPTDVALRFSTAALGNDKPSFGFHGRKACLLKYKAGWAMIENQVNNPTLEVATHLDPKIEITQAAPKTSLAIVELGRFGDIINILPICKLLHDQGSKPTIVVSKPFASLLDGVSYVDVFPVSTDYSDIEAAMVVAKRQFGRVVQAQVWGKAYQCERKCHSYNRESWRLLGYEHKFDDTTLKPVFDRRHRDREVALVGKFSASGKPMMLAGLTGGISSPFPAGKAILDWLRRAYGHSHEVIDLCSLKAERIYDLLGLFDASKVLFSSDTVYLHLAAASGVPVVAFVNPAVWVGTETRCNCLARIPYPDPSEPPEALLSTVEFVLRSGQPKSIRVWPTYHPTLFHAVECHVGDDDLRKQHARKSWDILYKQGVVPVYLSEYPRDATSIGDRRPLPFLKDVLALAMQKASDNDIIFWTNDDDWLHPDLAKLLQSHAGLYGACSSHRCNFRRIQDIPDKRSPSLIYTAALKVDHPIHVGRDLFAFKCRWLRERWKDIPDFILGASDFDLALACLVRLEFGIVSTRKNLEEAIHPCEIPRGYVAHVNHPSFWVRPDNIDSAPSQIHNRQLFREWARVALPSLHFFHKNVI